MLEDAMDQEYSVKFIQVTPNAESLMGYCARVSNPSNQDNPDVQKLLAYCIKNAHWSVFETAHMTLEIETSRGVAAQILRHRSFTFQEFSQRYAKASSAKIYQARRQDLKNRQNSVDDLSSDQQEWFMNAQKSVHKLAFELYEEALSRGIAKECARFLLPLSTETKLYMSGSIRSWIHYIQLRTANGTQKEHLDIALEAKKIFAQTLPITAAALGF